MKARVRTASGRLNSHRFNMTSPGLGRVEPFTPIIGSAENYPSLEEPGFRRPILSPDHIDLNDVVSARSAGHDSETNQPTVLRIPIKKRQHEIVLVRTVDNRFLCHTAPPLERTSFPLLRRGSTLLSSEFQLL